MKKMNNKGFAISSLLYALTIMVFLIIFALMSTMGSTRKNTRNLVDLIDDELNRYGLTNQTMIYDESIDNTTEGRKYFVNSNGWYQIELWGANYSGGHNFGGYASGIIYLEENQVLYIHLDKPQTQGDNTYINIDENDKDYTIMSISGGSTDTNATTNYMMYGYAGSRAGDTDDTISHLDVNGPQPIFYNGLVVPETNTSNNSKFKITKISNNDANNNPLTRYNDEKLKNVKYIKDCVTGSNKGSTSDWQEIQAISNGKNVALGKNIKLEPEGLNVENRSNIVNGELDNNSESLASVDGDGCVTVELDKQYDLDEIAVWHYYDKRRYRHHTLEVSSDKNNWTYIINYPNNQMFDTSESETAIGIRYSVYQNYKNITDGSYYIFVVGDDNKNKVLTNKVDSSLSLERFTGETNQKWILKSGELENASSHRYINKYTTNVECSKTSSSNYTITCTGENCGNICWLKNPNSNHFLDTERMEFTNRDPLRVGGNYSRLRFVKAY